MTASLGFVIGLVAGGVLVDSVGWRGVFFVNVPLCLVLAVMGRKALPRGTTVARDRHLDLPGALLVTAGVAALVYAPTLGTDDGWGSVEFVACLLVSAVLILAFLRVERRSRQPIIPLSIFRHHTLVVGDALMALVGALMAGEVLVLSLYAQQVLGYSPLVSGLIAIPQGVGGLLRGLVAARLLDRVGLRWFLAANWLLAAVCIWLLFRFPVTSHYPVLGIVLLGVGFGTTNVIFGGTVAGSTGISNDEQGVAGALVNAARQIGAAIGVAVVLSVAVLDGGTAVSGGASAAGYRLALLCWAGVAVAAAAVSLALPARKGTNPLAGARTGSAAARDLARREHRLDRLARPGPGTSETPLAEEARPRTRRRRPQLTAIVRCGRRRPAAQERGCLLRLIRRVRRGIARRAQVSLGCPGFVRAGAGAVAAGDVAGAHDGARRDGHADGGTVTVGGFVVEPAVGGHVVAPLRAQ